MSKLENNRVQQCGLCGRLTSDGRNLPSTNKLPYTKITWWDNFICRHCEWELRNLRLVNAAAEKRLSEQQEN